MRASRVVAFSYDSFPVPPGAADLRGDNIAPPAPATDDALLPLELDQYGNVRGDANLRDEIARRLGLPSADHIVITNGASEALTLALMVLADVGDKVACPIPAFPAYSQLATLLGLQLLRYRVDQNRCSPDPASLAEASIAIACEPHNPVGMSTLSDLMSVVDLAQTSVVVDSSHDLALLLPTSQTPEGAAVVGTFSKTFRLPGARVGFLASASVDLSDAAVAIKTHLSMATAEMSQAVARSLLGSAGIDEILTRQCAHIAECLQLLRESIDESRSLSRIGGVVGGHVCVEAPDISDEHELWSWLSEVGVVGIPGSVFEAPYPCVRLSAAQPRAVIERAASILSRC